MVLASNMERPLVSVGPGALARYTRDWRGTSLSVAEIFFMHRSFREAKEQLLL